MKFLFDINHPAHVHFFRNPMAILRARGHDILVTSRAKEIALPLLDELGIQHMVLSSQGGSGIWALAGELASRDRALYQVARRYRPDAMAAIGGTFIAHVRALTGIPALVFYDTENAKLQNLITYPFASQVIVPRCYQSWLPRHHRRYNGYHELSYLHPSRFTPDLALAIHNGLDPDRDNFFIRTVSWQANHDLLETGWSEELLRKLVGHLAGRGRGRVHVSSEAALPDDLAEYRYRGKVSEVHHLMAFCRMYIGESATMASECAVLGVPAIYAATTGRGYTDEQEARYGLVRNLGKLDWPAISSAVDRVMGISPPEWAGRRQQLLDDTMDVAAYVADTIEQFPREPA